MAGANKKRKSAAAEPSGDAFTALAGALRALDAVLTVAVDRQARLLGPASLLDPWRGMHIDDADVRRVLQGSAPASFFQAADAGVPALLAAPLRAHPRVRAIAHDLGLSDLDLAAMLIGLAPDLDLRYERIFAYLQDDIARKRPTLDLIANLLARDAGERLAVCARFAGAAPLVRSGLLSAVRGNGDTSVLARPWHVDEMWRKWLVGEDDIGPELGSGAELVAPAALMLDQLPLDGETRALIRRAIEASAARRIPLRLLLQGPHGAGKFELAQAISRELGQQLLVLDLRDCADANALRLLMQRAQRAATLLDAVLYIHGIARLEQREPQLLRALIDALAASSCSVVLACASSWPPVHAAALPILRVELGYPSAAARRAIWREALLTRDIAVDADVEAHIASRFSLNAAQIRQAASEACLLSCTTGSRVGYAELAAAARMQCGTELARLARKVDPRADFDALVVPSEVQAQLREICARVSTRERIGLDWAHGSVHARRTGVTALFVGPSGTGKTLSAEAVAHELGLDLYRIDLAGIVSKYIGETEKNLDRVFAAAEHANAVLFFDEADALFGKRSEVKDAHDRYANIEIAYLLQKMEQFDGLAILATNLKQNLDEAFARRLTFTVTFPFPEEPERRQLWERLWPPRAPRADDVDLAWFAREFRLSGGNICNAVMAAAHLAAADGQVVTHDHLMHATRREYQKLGKNLVHSAAGERRAG